MLLWEEESLTVVNTKRQVDAGFQPAKEPLIVGIMQESICDNYLRLVELGGAFQNAPVACYFLLLFLTLNLTVFSFLHDKEPNNESDHIRKSGIVLDSLRCVKERDSHHFPQCQQLVPSLRPCLLSALIMKIRV